MPTVLSDQNLEQAVGHQFVEHQQFFSCFHDVICIRRGAALVLLGLGGSLCDGVFQDPPAMIYSVMNRSAAPGKLMFQTP